MTLNRKIFAGMIAVMATWFAGHVQSAEIIVPTDSSTIQAAIDKAVSGDTIIVEPGTYKENITIQKSSVTLKGRETARTFLQLPSTDLPVITVTQASDINIRNFTFIGSGFEATAIKITQSSNIKITNNVFDIGSLSIGIDIPENQNIDIINNTFYDTKTAIAREFITTNIKSNIFVKNDKTITGEFTNNISFNCFYENSASNIITGSDSITGEDPLFVDSENSDYQLRDFHLKKGSPCIGKGAWGGDNADSTIFPVKNVQLQDVVVSYGIDVTWDANLSHQVTGYKIYYDSDRSGKPYNGTDAAAGNSAIDVGSVTTAKLENLSPAAAQPDAPVLSELSGSYQRLTASWSTVAGATGYQIHYGINDVTENEVSVGNVTSYTLTGLDNGMAYKVALSALSKTTYYVVVTAYDNAGNESNYSDEASIVIGNKFESDRSAEKIGTPEKIIPYPDLPDEGCFIATAAYGSYGATEVQILRNFRDQYLLTNNIGRDVVRLYYTHSPSIAQLISDSALLKHTVKLMLTPVVAGSSFLLSVDGWLKQLMENRQTRLE